MHSCYKQLRMPLGTTTQCVKPGLSHPTSGVSRLPRWNQPVKARPLVPWPGGKRRLSKQLFTLFPKHTCYVEPFCGAAGMLFEREYPAKAEILNDINKDLILLYRCVQHHLEEFCRQYKWALVSREMFRWAQLKHPETLTDTQRAARFFYLQQLSFGAKVEGQSFGTATTAAPVNFMRIEEALSAAHARLSRVTIECLPWAKCIERYDRRHTLFFCDPPYWATAGYGVDFDLEQYEALAVKLDEIKGSFVLTINDHPQMRAIFKRFESIEIQTTYTMGRLGKSVPRFERAYFRHTKL